MKKRIFASLCIALAMGATACSTASEKPAATTTAAAETTINAETAANEQNTEDTMTKLSDDAVKYEANTYVVGSDIPAGEYVVFCDSYVGYFEVAKDDSGTLDAIIAGDNMSYSTIVTVSDGQHFKLTGCYAVPIESVSELDTSGEGMFKIGTHLPAGEYQVELDADSVLGYGYVEVMKDSTQTPEAIISSEDFEDSVSVTVTDGQYLALSGCHIAN